MSTQAATPSPAPKTQAGAPGTQAPQQAPSQADGKPTGTPAPQERKLKIKVDGQELELPESEVLQLASAGRSSNKRFQEAAALKKQAEEVLQMSKQDQIAFFKKNGVDPRKWAEEFLMGELKKESETPEQKKARENEEELRKYRDQEKATAEQKKFAEAQRLTNEHRERYDKLFTQALFESGLPRTPFTVMRMAELQRINLKKKLELPASKLAQLVREDYINEQKNLFGSLDGDKLIEMLGKDVVKKISKAQIAKLKARGTTPTQQTPTNQQPQQEMTWREYQKKNRGRA